MKRGLKTLYETVSVTENKVDTEFKHTRSLTPSQCWLRSHQVTVLAQALGVYNKLWIPQEETTLRYTNRNGYFKDTPQNGGKTYVVVSERYMHEQLLKTLKWLVRYKEVWNTDGYADAPCNSVEDLLKEDTHRLDVLRLIELLQDKEAQ